MFAQHQLIGLWYFWKNSSFFFLRSTHWNMENLLPAHLSRCSTNQPCWSNWTFPSSYNSQCRWQGVVSWHLLSAEDVVSEGKALLKITLFWYYNRINRAPNPSFRWHWLTQSLLEIQLIVDGADNLISKDSHWIIHEPGIEIIYMQCNICMSTLVLQLKSIFIKTLFLID